MIHTPGCMEEPSDRLIYKPTIRTLIREISSDGYYRGHFLAGTTARMEVQGNEDYLVRAGELISVRKDYEGVFTVPKGVTGIFMYAFEDCERITKIDMQDVECIACDACSNCVNLESVCMPNVHTIYSDAFNGCEKLNIETTLNINKVISNQLK